jgi:hypothetical protein
MISAPSFDAKLTRAVARALHRVVVDPGGQLPVQLDEIGGQFQDVSQTCKAGTGVVYSQAHSHQAQLVERERAAGSRRPWLPRPSGRDAKAARTPMTERPQPCGHWAQHASRSRRHRSGGSRPSGTRALRDSRPEVSGCRSAGPADRHRNRKSATTGRERIRRERRRQLQRGSWPRRQPAASVPPGRQRVLSPPRGQYGQPQRIALPANFERLSARLLLATEWPASRLLSFLVFGRSAPGHEAHHPVITPGGPPDTALRTGLDLGGSQHGPGAWPGAGGELHGHAGRTCSPVSVNNSAARLSTAQPNIDRTFFALPSGDLSSCPRSPRHDRERARRSGVPRSAVASPLQRGSSVRTVRRGLQRWRRERRRGLSRA